MNIHCIFKQTGEQWSSRQCDRTDELFVHMIHEHLSNKWITDENSMNIDVSIDNVRYPIGQVIFPDNDSNESYYTFKILHHDGYEMGRLLVDKTSCIFEWRECAMNKLAEEIGIDVDIFRFGFICVCDFPLLS